MSDQAKPRLAILTNIVSPNTAPLYRLLMTAFETVVLISGHEDNRTWDVNSLHSELTVKRARGITLKWNKRSPGGRVWEDRYTHLNPGYLVSLWRFRPHAILSNEMGFRSLIAALYGKACRIPVWVWWEGTSHTESSISSTKRILRRFGFRYLVPGWVTSGTNATTYLTSIGVDPGRIRQAQNTVNAQLFAKPVEPRSLETPRPIALCVGRLTGLKGIDKLLEVTALLQQSDLEFSLVIVGDGPEAEHLHGLAADYKVKNVLWIPNVPVENMPQIYRSADFLVFPTLADVWGLVVNEALISGLPVIASRYAGCASELLPETNVFDPLNQEDFLAVYRRAVHGAIAKPDLSPLKTTEEVAAIIEEDIRRHLVQL